MKKILAILASLALAVVLFAGCGSISNPAGSTGRPVGGEGGTVTPPTPSDPDETYTFTATVMYNGELFTQRRALKAQWYDGITRTEATVEDSVATIDGLNGDYRVTLSGLDSNYTYNPNVNYATNDRRDVVIEVYRLTTPNTSAGNNGSGPYKAMRVYDQGYYRATFQTQTQVDNGIYFLYEPDAVGYYRVESIMDIGDNQINPIVDVYIGNKAYASPDGKPTQIIDSGGVSANYTKNFRYELELTSVGGVYRFAIRFDARNKPKLPVSIDFQIYFSREVPPEGDPPEVVVAHENFTQRKKDLQSIWDGNGSWTYADVNGTFRGSDYAFNESDGLWHVGTPDGPVLWAKINADCVILVTDSATGFMDGLVSKSNLQGKNYNSFVATYAGNCNSDGAYPVTTELKQFLQDYATHQPLFMDGRGWAESMGYHSTEDDMWLFACGYYE